MSRRLTHIDTDHERLPSGMKRVAYDADTQRYTYQDRDGSLWQGEEGAQYGVLTRKPESPQRLFSDSYHNDLLPPYQERTGCTRTSPNAPCSCYFCAASIPSHSRSSSTASIVQSVAQGIRRTVSVRKQNLKLSSPSRTNTVKRPGSTGTGSRRGTL